jgi:hypothetical protein
MTEEDLKAMRTEAEAYVAGLVAGTQRRVIFVDPDFGLREVQNYALRVMRDDVEVKILTGAPRMRVTPRPDENASGASPDPRGPAAPVAHGVHLLAQLRHVQNKLGGARPKCS